MPGYGISLQDGFEDTFTATATGALEYGSIPYAKGVIDNWLRFYVRDNGMTTYRAEELAQSGRMLTIFALYVSMTGDTKFMLDHFDKAEALGDWLAYRWEHSLEEFPVGDPRHGIPPGLDEGDGFIGIFAGHPGSHSGYANQLDHDYSCASGIYRGFADAGEMWVAIGTKHNRPDVTAHGKILLGIAPKLRVAIQTSMTMTSWKLPNGRTCWPNRADEGSHIPSAACIDGGGRTYPEMFYSGVLTYEQIDDIYTTLTLSNNTKYVTRPMTLGCAGLVPCRLE